MTAWLISVLLVSSLGASTVAKIVTSADYHCAETKQCWKICGEEQGWCLSGWCACSRKRQADNVGPDCQTDEGCSSWKCNGVGESSRCLWNKCLCIPELGR